LEWDIVPYNATDTAKIIDRRREHIGRQNNAFWFAHRLYKSKAKVIYTSAYEIPPEIGKFDIAIFGQVLLHIRDPFRAMECILRHCRDQVVVVETLMSRKQNFVLKLLNRLQREQTFPVFFLPRGAKQHPIDTWWKFPEWTMEEYLRVLGFEKTSVVYHEPIHHKAKSNKARLYSMVAKRPS